MLCSVSMDMSLSLSIPPNPWVVAVVATHVCELLCYCPFPTKSDMFQHVLSLKSRCFWCFSLLPCPFSSVQWTHPDWFTISRTLPIFLVFQSQCLRERKASMEPGRRGRAANQRRERGYLVQKRRSTTPPPSLDPSKTSGPVSSFHTEEPAWGSGHLSRWDRPGYWWMSTTTVCLQLQGGPTFQSAPSKTEPGSWSRPR